VVANERGATLAEAAFVLPVLLLLTFGIWTTARAWNVDNTLAHAAREAARYGATVDTWDTTASPGEIRAVADADLDTSSIDTTAVTDCIELVAPATSPTCDPSYTNGTSSDQVYVQLTYADYPLNFLFFSLNLELDGTAISRFEASP
jgi:Flp pilus assembly protein TadG